MGETSEIDAATSRAACASLARRIESGLGKAAKLDLKLATPDFELLEEAALSALLPAKAFAFGLEAEGAVSLLLIVEDRGALALALGATGADVVLLPLLERMRSEQIVERLAVFEALRRYFQRSGPDGRAADPLLAALGVVRLATLRGVDHFATPKALGFLDAALDFLSA
ncbi:MAG: hypothetical protein KDB35_12245 [Acidimicrobiales bacterium]|nr:hypothetical protein [Acidimicrobiales bacterium]